MLRKLRARLAPLRATPLHPQWLAPSRSALLPLLKEIAPGSSVLDIGCADAWPRLHLEAGVRYTGLDYPDTAIAWYGTRPDVFADASQIPFPDETFDAVMLFDVLEHLQNPAAVLAEIFRVLKPGGRLLMNTPFMYPLHDEPRDFRRWTLHGHRELAHEAGFTVERLEATGSPVRSAFLLLNIALTKFGINALSRLHPGVLLLPVLPFAVLLNNVLAWLLIRLEPADGMMPTAYQGLWRRPATGSLPP